MFPIYSSPHQKRPRPVLEKHRVGASLMTVIRFAGQSQTVKESPETIAKGLMACVERLRLLVSLKGCYVGRPRGRRPPFSEPIPMLTCVSACNFGRSRPE